MFVSGVGGGAWGGGQGVDISVPCAYGAILWCIAARPQTPTDEQHNPSAFEQWLVHMVAV